MSLHSLDIVLNLLFVVGGLFTLYAAYFCIIAAFGLKKHPECPDTTPKTRFAVLVAARNEEQVIASLIGSLKEQNYPRELYDIYVAPNNCTDQTEAVARNSGAKIFTPKGVIKMKGQVLHQFVDFALKCGGQYEAICVFDADNLVHPDFLQKMNDAYQHGVQVAQGNRDSKNPRDSAMASCYAMYYWIVNRFYNGGREALGLSSLVVGSGYMMSMKMLKKLGGWNTQTITEDYEFSAQCVLAGEKVHYVQGAIIYDELPLTFAESWRQRRRWSTGFVQGMRVYMGKLFAHAIRHKSFATLDMALAYIAPITQLFSLICGAASLLLSAYGVLQLNLMPLTQAVLLVVAAVAVAFVGSTLFAAWVTYVNRNGNLRGFGKGIAMFAIFLVSFMPIGIISLFRQKTNWEAIQHTRAMGLQDLGH